MTRDAVFLAVLPVLLEHELSKPKPASDRALCVRAQALTDQAMLTAAQQEPETAAATLDVVARPCGRHVWNLETGRCMRCPAVATANQLARTRNYHRTRARKTFPRSVPA